MNFRSILVGLLLSAAPLLAHHSVTAEFDSNRPITLHGVVTNVDWMNPHTYFFVEVRDMGKTRTWACELGNPQELQRRGFTRESLKVGMPVQVTGTRAKDGSYKIHTDALTANSIPLLGK